MGYGVAIERRWYRLRHLAVPGVLRGPGDLTILHISDTHLAPPQQHRVDFLRRLADEDYDLVVATGDLLGDLGAEDALVDALTPLTADGTPGLVVLGSNDLFGPTPKNPFLYFTDPDERRYGGRHDTARMLRGLADVGYTTLRNERTVVETAAGTVAVGGIDDPHLDPTRLPRTETIAVELPDADLALGLVHAPYQAALDLMTGAGYGLVLAGHTHGGQVRLPGIGALTANCDIPLDQARGLSRWGASRLHVSPGLGHSPYAPFRFACRPEATLLHLPGGG